MQLDQFMELNHLSTFVGLDQNLYVFYRLSKSIHIEQTESSELVEIRLASIF